MTARSRRRRRASRPATAAATAVATLLLAGCGADDPKPGPEVAGGNAGVDEQVGSGIKVLDVELEFPLDGSYEAGEDARLFLAISNLGESPDDLLSVTGPDFAEARLTGEADGFPLTVDAENTAYVGAEGEPVITLLDLERELRSSQSIPVTFRFEDAGAVTVDAVVAAEGQTPAPTYDFPDPDEDPSGDT